MTKLGESVRGKLLLSQLFMRVIVAPSAIISIPNSNITNNNTCNTSSSSSSNNVQANSYGGYTVPSGNPFGTAIATSTSNTSLAGSMSNIIPTTTYVNGIKRTNSTSSLFASPLSSHGVNV